MKKSLTLILAFLCMITFVFSSNVVIAESNYYASTEGLVGEELLNELAVITQENHSYFTSYDDIRQMNAISDKDPNDSSKLLDFYSGISINAAWDGGITWNREHVWCQSLSGGLYGDKYAGADVHHIRPTISSINSSRNNSLYGELNDRDNYAKYYDIKGGINNSTGTIYGYLDGSIDPTDATSQEEGVFEPVDSVKGDVARIIMYMYMHYSDEVEANINYKVLKSNNTFTLINNPSDDRFSIATKISGPLSIENIIYTGEDADAAWELLLSWNDLDGVDEFERNRNEYCSSITKARNPFIDNPEFAEKIWGDASSLEGDKYNVTYHVEENAKFDYVDSKDYLANRKIKNPTETPILTGYKFVGWYKEETLENEWNFDADLISSNLHLYAKFEKLSIADVLENVNIQSQLVFAVDKIAVDNGVETETVVINKFIAGEGQIPKATLDLSDYLEFDTSLFEILVKPNNMSSQSLYIKSSNKEIRLYPGGGNGSSLDITAKDGVKIKEVTCGYTKKTPTITYGADGKTAKIHNTVSQTSGSDNQVVINSISITYEQESKGYSYVIKDGTLAINYVLSLTEEQYNVLITSEDELVCKLGDEEVGYDIVKYGENYRVICNVIVSDVNTVYIPIFTYKNVNKTINGYSAKTLANYYLNNLSLNDFVKEYKECLKAIID